MQNRKIAKTQKRKNRKTQKCKNAETKKTRNAKKVEKFFLRENSDDFATTVLVSLFFRGCNFDAHFQYQQ